MNHAVLALGASVSMHVGWNLIARRAPQDSWPLWWALLGHLLLFAPWGWWSLWQEAQASPLLCALAAMSALANAIYFIALAQAYERAPISLVYPMVRSSPLLIALWGQLFLGQTLGAGTWLGLGVSGLGLVVMALSTLGSAGAGASALDQAAVRKALPWALLAMLSTSVYSLSDKAATAYLPSTGALLGYVSLSYLCAFAALSLRLKRRTGAWRPPRRLPWRLCGLGALCIGWAYVLVVHAMRQMPAAEVVGYTNAGIVIATLVGMLVFGERFRWPVRLGGALLISAGLALMAR
ncbi:EamA family transporter [Kinneretia asaccharophila]|jgi:phosphonate utilization associated putative membrane protein|uniref:Phosphonate utilization associated putative membrane protein n=1 Tax=Roseateles asaccharophilus TaxID=582607 RepID=A0A4R6NFD6_9BURK|nr:EamA family transporter [Roseateles asaccharophilus]MDN3543337.1 EamA family transporter [Roseateles asaccharophilus]TDP12964.1 phosphonate utilization associated putative membrane protein [Roseateles asaccharophilus]